MPVIRWPHQPTISRAAMQHIEAAQLLGEQVIILNMYRVGRDEGVAPRCPNCYDDVYKDSDTSQCPVCFGTTFQGGVKQMSRAWAIPGDADNTQEFKPRGAWESDTRSVQVERYPDLFEHDYLIRVFDWGPNWVPRTLGPRYRFSGAVHEVSLRTGARYNQTFLDRIAQTSNLALVDRQSPIQLFKIPEGQPILRDPHSPIID